MRRRKFLKSMGLAGAGVALAAPAVAQSTPEIKWRLTSSFPRTLDALWNGGELFCRRVADITDGKFKITPFAAGEIVPGLQAFDAVQNGTVEMCHTASYYAAGKDTTFVFDTGLPFGLNCRQHVAWWMHGGGRELMNEFYKDYGVLGLMSGATGAQMGGWFRKEIKSLDDLKGLKFRISGLAGSVIAKLGVVPQLIAPGDTYTALERGAIDAVEWVGPYDDEKLGFYKVAPYYYYPGWWEGNAMGTFYFNLKAWEALPPSYQKSIETAANETTLWTTARYDNGDPPALRRLVAGGAKLQAFPLPVLEAAFDAANELYAEICAKNAKFKKVFDQWKGYRSEQVMRWRVTESSFDNFIGRQHAAGKL